MRNHQLVSVLAAGAVALLASADGIAAFTEYAGAQCVRVSGGIYNYQGGTVYNSSSLSTLNVICPLTRETSGLDGAQIYVYDRHPTQSVSCNVVSENYSEAGISATFNSMASTGTGFKLLENFTNLTFSTVYATCSIPPSSGGAVSHVATLITYPLTP